ncbi:MAG: hypothetical protein GF370_01420 [Candidatus Nealsonbacteria bacterium]|nr:hypothetical protein [Candidatus Nealsonbacteria bacterium]
MKTALVYNPKIRKYGFGKGHPFTSERFESFIAFAKENIPGFEQNLEMIEPGPASENDLKLVHTEKYIEVMKKASRGIKVKNLLDYVTPDNLNPSTGYLPEGMHEAGKIAVGSSLKAAELVLQEKFKKAISLGGGLHHAKPEKGEGFCIYNDVAVTAKHLLRKGIKKVLILDTDAHAGNGTAEIFYEEPSVLLIDFHQDPATLYPGTGFPEQRGRGKGEGFTVNIALPPDTGDDAWQYCFEQIVFPLTEEFGPEIIIRNGGSDPYFADGLTNLGLTLKGLRMVGENVRKISQKVCEGREVDLIASGYNQNILPQAWTSLISGLLDLEIKITEPKNPDFPSSFKLEETKEKMEGLKEELKPFWKCFRY